MDDKYRPRTFEELASDPVPVSLINEPLPPENVRALPVAKAHSLHAVLCDALTSRAAVRELYVQVRRTVQVLSKCLELPELE